MFSAHTASLAVRSILYIQFCSSELLAITSHRTIRLFDNVHSLCTDSALLHFVLGIVAPTAKLDFEVTLAWSPRPTAVFCYFGYVHRTVFHMLSVLTIAHARGRQLAAGVQSERYTLASCDGEAIWPSLQISWLFRREWPLLTDLLMSIAQLIRHPHIISLGWTNLCYRCTSSSSYRRQGSIHIRRNIHVYWVSRGRSKL